MIPTMRIEIKRMRTQVCISKKRLGSTLYFKTKFESASLTCKYERIKRTNAPPIATSVTTKTEIG